MGLGGSGRPVEHPLQHSVIAVRSQPSQARKLVASGRARHAVRALRPEVCKHGGVKPVRRVVVPISRMVPVKHRAERDRHRAGVGSQQLPERGDIHRRRAVAQDQNVHQPLSRPSRHVETVRAAAGQILCKHSATGVNAQPRPFASGRVYPYQGPWRRGGSACRAPRRRPAASPAPREQRPWRARAAPTAGPAAGRACDVRSQARSRRRNTSRRARAGRRSCAL